MKQRVLWLLCAVFLLCMPVRAAEWSREEGDGSYITIRVPYAQAADLGWAESRYLGVRYKDTGEAVPLTSDIQFGGLFVTVPAADKNRSLEVFQGERFPWADCPWENEPMAANILHIRDVIQGDENGSLNPDKELTRAEAFTILVRLLSLEGREDPGYADVMPEDWFYDTVSAARAAGLAAGDTHFRPNDSVTRAEFTTMVYRAFCCVGWLEECEGAEAELNLVDRRELPAWAESAYLALGSAQENILICSDFYGSDLDAEGFPMVYRFADSHKAATRREVMEMVYAALRWLPLYPTETAMAWGFDREMPVIDGSTSTYPYTRALYGALFDNPTRHPLYPASHSKSHASYERLIAGEADVLFAATKPSEELRKLAMESGVELECIPIAYDAMVFFTNSANDVQGLTSRQIRDIYVNNAYTNWSELGGKDAALIPYCRNRDSGSQALMEQFFLDGADIHPGIRQETTSLSMASILTDVERACQAINDPCYGLGYSIYYYYETARMILLGDDALKLLTIDGVMPSDETIADGSYPLAGFNYLVLRADAPVCARKLAQFMVSRAGQNVVVNAGFGALTR